MEELNWLLKLRKGLLTTYWLYFVEPAFTLAEKFVPLAALGSIL